MQFVPDFGEFAFDFAPRAHLQPLLHIQLHVPALHRRPCAIPPYMRQRCRLKGHCCCRTSEHQHHKQQHHRREVLTASNQLDLSPPEMTALQAKIAALSP
eukprot:398385-Rhodomonas_salina.1